VCGWGTETGPASKSGRLLDFKWLALQGAKKIPVTTATISPLRSNPLTSPRVEIQQARDTAARAVTEYTGADTWLNGSKNREREREGEREGRRGRERKPTITTASNFFPSDHTYTVASPLFSLLLLLFLRLPISSRTCLTLAQAAQTCLAERPPNLVPSSFSPSHTPLSPAPWTLTANCPLLLSSLPPSLLLLLLLLSTLATTTKSSNHVFRKLSVDMRDCEYTAVLASGTLRLVQGDGTGHRGAVLFTEHRMGKHNHFPAC